MLQNLDRFGVGGDRRSMGEIEGGCRRLSSWNVLGWMDLKEKEAGIKAFPTAKMPHREDAGHLVFWVAR
jgi:hypothetical protein